MSTAKAPIRVVAIDDSSTMRHMYQKILSGCPDIVLLDMARDGLSGMEMVYTLRPDVVLLDIEMPGIDGLDVLTRLRERIPHLPVIMCSTLTHQGAAVTLEALFRGAADYVAKPHLQITPQAAMESFRAPLVERIRALGARVCPDLSGTSSNLAQQPLRQLRMDHGSYSIQVVVLGASTGGPQAIEQVLSRLPGNFPVPVLIVQHIPPLFVPLLVERLQKHCPLHIVESCEGCPLLPRTVSIARGDWHLRIASAPPLRSQGGSRSSGSSNSGTSNSGTEDRAVQRLTQDAPIHYCRPAVDALFLSAAEIFGPTALGVVLTGMGSDATEGARAIRAAGGTILVQDAATSTIWGMPGSIAQAGLAHAVLPLEEIADEIVRRVYASGARPCATAPPPLDQEDFASKWRSQ